MEELNEEVVESKKGLTGRDEGKPTILIPGEIESVSKRGVTVAAGTVYDYGWYNGNEESQGAFQEHINRTLKTRIESINNTIDEVVSPAISKIPTLETKIDNNIPYTILYENQYINIPCDAYGNYTGNEDSFGTKVRILHGNVLELLNADTTEAINHDIDSSIAQYVHAESSGDSEFGEIYINSINLDYISDILEVPFHVKGKSGTTVSGKVIFNKVRQGKSAFDIWKDEDPVNRANATPAMFITDLKNVDGVYGPKYAYDETAAISDADGSTVVYFIPNAEDSTKYDIVLVEGGEAKPLAQEISGDITNYAGIYDVSADHNGTQYSSLQEAVAATSSNACKGGMEIKYIDSNTGKYRQFRLIKPVFGSAPTLVDLSGLSKLALLVRGSDNTWIAAANAGYYTKRLPLDEGYKYTLVAQQSSETPSCIYEILKSTDNGTAGRSVQYADNEERSSLNAGETREIEVEVGSDKAILSFRADDDGKQNQRKEPLIYKQNINNSYTFNEADWVEHIPNGESSKFASLNLGKVSIIGDSISTFKGYIKSGYRPYYPQYDVREVTDMWWKMLFGDNIEVNASWSGSLATNNRDEDFNNVPFPSFYDRTGIGVLGSPDTIIVSIGGNDYRYRANGGITGNTVTPVKIGYYNYDDAINDLDESYFRTAYIKGIKSLKENYPSANIVIVIIYTDGEFKESIIRIAEHFGIKVIDTDGYERAIDNVHATAKGQIDIARSVYNALSTDVKDVITKDKAPISSEAVFENIYKDKISYKKIYEENIPISNTKVESGVTNSHNFGTNTIPFVQGKTYKARISMEDSAIRKLSLYFANTNSKSASGFDVKSIPCAIEEGKSEYEDFYTCEDANYNYAYVYALGGAGTEVVKVEIFEQRLGTFVTDNQLDEVTEEISDRIGEVESTVTNIENKVENTGLVEYGLSNFANIGYRGESSSYVASSTRVSIKLPYNFDRVEITSCAEGYRFALQGWQVKNPDVALIAVEGERTGNSSWITEAPYVLKRQERVNYSVITFSKSDDSNITPQEAFDNIKFKVYVSDKMFWNHDYDDVEVVPASIDMSVHRCWCVWEQPFTHFGANTDGLQSSAIYGNYLFQYQSAVHMFRVFTLSGVKVGEFSCDVIGHGNSIQFGTIVHDGDTFPYMYCSGKTDDDNQNIRNTIQVLKVTTDSYILVKSIILDANVNEYSDIAIDFKNDTLYVYSTNARSGEGTNVKLTKYTATNLQNADTSELSHIDSVTVYYRDNNADNNIGTDNLGTQQGVCVFNGMFCVLASHYNDAYSKIYFFKTSDLSLIGTYTWSKSKDSEYQSLMPYNYNGRWLIYMAAWFATGTNPNRKLYYRLSYIQ